MRGNVTTFAFISSENGDSKALNTELVISVSSSPELLLNG